jgi:predicted transport protein
MNLMFNNQADFILEYNEKTLQKLERKDVEWSQSRIIFISPEFNKYQQHAIGFKDLGIRLYELKKYDNSLYLFDEIKPLETSKSISMIAKSNPIAKKVSEVIKTYTEEEILYPAEEKTKSIYYELKKHILDFGDDVEVRATKKYIAYRRNKSFAGFVILKNVLKIYLSVKKSALQDPANKARNVEGIGHYAPGDTEVIASSENDIHYVLGLIAQSYQIN